MSRTNKQHYVPQFLLRNFALGGAGDDIACYRISDARFVPRVGTKNVAHENHFYGLQNVEKALGGIESLASRAIRQAIETASVPAFRSHEHHAILLFALLQSSRTPRAAEVTQERFDEVAKTVVSNMPELSEYHSRLDDFLFRLDNAPSESARLGLSSYPVLLDLRFKLLCNRTTVPFIISDHPAVQYNQFLEGRATLKGATGLASCGFQLFLPLSPLHQLIFYDPDVYRVGYRKLTNQTVEVTSDRDVRDLNMLQAVAASEALFFNHLFSEADATILVQKAKKYRARIESYADPIRTRLTLPCITVTPQAQRRNLHSQIDFLRDPAFLELSQQFHNECRAGRLQLEDFCDFYLHAKALGF